MGTKEVLYLLGFVRGNWGGGQLGQLSGTLQNRAGQRKPAGHHADTDRGMSGVILRSPPPELSQQRRKVSREWACLSIRTALGPGQMGTRRRGALGQAQPWFWSPAGCKDQAPTWQPEVVGVHAHGCCMGWGGWSSWLYLSWRPMLRLDSAFLFSAHPAKATASLQSFLRTV